MKRKYSKLLDNLKKILYKPKYVFQVNYDGKDLVKHDLSDVDSDIIIVTYKIRS